MRGFRLLLPLLAALASANDDINYNWLTLALHSSPDNFPASLMTANRSTFQGVCNRLIGLNPVQKRICSESPLSLSFVARGVREAIYECQMQFKYERWNCSDRYEITRTPHGDFHDILGKSLRGATKESAFLVAVASAGLVHAIAKGCNTGNLTECGCDGDPTHTRYIEEPSSAPGRQESFTWGGCSDNVPYATKYARRFLDEWHKAEFEADKNVTHLVTNHNHFVGREAIAQNLRRACRCHGVSGSCEFKTCWLQMPKIEEVAAQLKKRYDNFAVQVTKRAKKRLRRKEKAQRQHPIRGNEMAYVSRSPSYCEQDNSHGILGTRGRECAMNSLNADSCELLCCGRGYNTRIERRKTQCNCKFVWCCQVKCKECVDDVQVHTCK